MGKTNANNDDEKFIQTAVQVGLAIDEARAPSDKVALEIIEQRIAQAESGAPEKAEKAEKSVGEKAWETTKQVGGAVGGAFAEIGKSEWGSLTENNFVARAISGKGNGASDEQIAAANDVVEKYSLSKQGIVKIPRSAFHLTTTLPICTANAVVRCSCGLAFGPLKVPPLNRTCLGTPPNPVANIMDCIPNEFNIPQFVLCFNILNPAVAAATAIATAAKGGVFTLTPAPCIGTMAPSPWLPTTKNTLGKTPLLTQTSSSVCWGLGSINILHCGQGLSASIASRFYVPGDPLATVKGYVESLVNLAGGLGGMLAVGGKLSAGIGNAFRMAKLQRLGVGMEAVSNSSKFGMAMDAIDMGGNTIHAGISFKQGDTGGGVSDLANVGVSAFMKGKAHVQTNQAKSNLKNAQGNLNQKQGALKDSTTAQGDAQRKLQQADENISTANTNLAASKEARAQADTNLANAKTKQAEAETNLANAKTKQAEADTNLSNAKAKQAEADTNLANAKTKQTEADTNLANAKAKQAEADTKLNEATKKKEEVYANPNSTKEEKLEADLDVAMAKGDKGMADADVNMATRNKIEADANANIANHEKFDADFDASRAKTEKDMADWNVQSKQTQKEWADSNVNEKQRQKTKADEAVEDNEILQQKAKDERKQREQEYNDAVADTNAKQKERDDAIQNFRDRRSDLRNVDNPSTFDNAVNAGKAPVLNATSSTINELGKEDKDYDKFLSDD